jgi:cytochrome c-type biogenesis protein CcmH/NrfG
LGLALEGLGDPSGAIDAYRRAIELDPKSDDARKRLDDLVQRSAG